MAERGLVGEQRGACRPDGTRAADGVCRVAHDAQVGDQEARQVVALVQEEEALQAARPLRRGRRQRAAAAHHLLHLLPHPLPLQTGGRGPSLYSEFYLNP